MQTTLIRRVLRRGQRYSRLGTRGVFADRVGLTLFVGSLVFFVLYWRIGFFINDNWTIANTLANLANGHLHITEIVYGSPDGNHPGMHLVDGKLYGRNYGLAFLALPILWGLQLLSTVVSIPIVIAAAWSLGIIWLGLMVGNQFVSIERVRVLSPLLGVTVFAGNVVFAQPIAPRWYPLMALQIVTMLAAGFLAVLVYRVLSYVEDRRTGAVLGLVVIVGTPVGFWAVIPKRHVIIAALAMLSFYGFARSRTLGAANRRGYRAVSYAAVGLSAWVFPAEAIILFAVLTPFDVLTSPSNSARELTVIGFVFFVSLLPAFLTNYLVVGNPLEPPKLWPRYTGQADVLSSEPNGDTGSGFPGLPGGSDGAATPGGDESTGGSRSTGIVSLILGLTKKAMTSLSAGFSRLFPYVDTGLNVVITDPDRVYHVFIRSGWLELKREYGINLSILETAPILGLFFALPVIAYRSIRDRGVRAIRMVNPTDAFALSYVVLLSLLYLHRLPMYATVTVRFLVPILPFAVYGIGRLNSVQRLIHSHHGPGLWTYAGTILIGTQAWLLWLIVGQPMQEEAIQLQAMIGFVVGILLGVWAILRYTGSYQGEWEIGSLLVGLSVGVTTVFLLQTGLIYVQYGEFALGMVDVLVERISVLVHTVVSGVLS